MKFSHSIIKTTERMTYNHVNRILIDENPELCERYASISSNV